MEEVSPADRGTLGDQAARMRGQRTTAPPPPTERDATTRALGAGLGLLGTFVGAIAFAFVMSRLVGGMYVTFVMPLFVGMLLAAFAAMGPKRFPWVIARRSSR